MTTKAKGNSIRQCLLNIHKQTGVSFLNLETEFLIEHLVARLVSNEPLRESLVFKGGFVGLRVYQSSRYTVDLDALLMRSNLDNTLEKTKAAAEQDLGDGVWFHFEEQMDLATQGEYGGIRQVYRTGIGERLKNVKKAQIINFDLGIGDPVTPRPIATETRGLLSDEDLSWSVYPIETIIAEKLHALVVREEANSRSKDIYDLKIFLPKADKEVLKTALKKCFAYRGADLPQSFSEFLKSLNTAVLERGWPSAVASILDAPQFKTAFAELISHLEDFERE